MEVDGQRKLWKLGIETAWERGNKWVGSERQCARVSAWVGGLLGGQVSVSACLSEWASD